MKRVCSRTNRLQFAIVPKRVTDKSFLISLNIKQNDSTIPAKDDYWSFMAESVSDQQRVKSKIVHCPHSKSTYNNTASDAPHPVFNYKLHQVQFPTTKRTRKNVARWLTYEELNDAVKAIPLKAKFQRDFWKRPEILRWAIVTGAIKHTR